MKTKQLLGLTGLIALLSTSGQAQDVNFYNVQKTEFLGQTSASAPAVNWFTLGAVVGVRSGGSLSSGSLALASGSGQSSPVAFGLNGNGNLSFASANFSTQAGLDAQFSNGSYGFSVTGGSGSYSASLLLTGNAYVSPAPTITNTNWSGGALLIDPAQDFTLTWNTFSGFSTGDSEQLSGTNNSFFFYNSDTTSQLFPAGSFAPNSTYTFTLGFEKVTAEDTSSIPGASGQASYIENNRFTVTTVPEPSSLGLILSAGAVGLLQRRRRAGH